jgi:hypothetical protein
MGRTSNLGSILGVRYGWTPQSVVFTIARYHLDVTLRLLLIAIYTIAMIVCALATARLARRRDPRMLVAIITPWLLMFALLPQMHERYLVYAAAVSALAAGVDLGLTLLHLLVTAISAVMIAQGMLVRDPAFAPAWLKFVNGTHPDVGWLVLLCTAIFLYAALMPRRLHFRSPALSSHA